MSESLFQLTLFHFLHTTLLQTLHTREKKKKRSTGGKLKNWSQWKEAHSRTKCLLMQPVEALPLTSSSQRRQRINIVDYEKREKG